MKIQLNGEPYECDPGTTVAGLLEKLELRGDQVAVERNRSVVRGEERDRQTLRDGDRVEVVQFVGGG